MISTADALAFCMAQPGASAADCRAEVNAQLVGGAYCDGRVVMSLGPNGEHQKRCVPTSVLAQKLALWRPPPTGSRATHGSTETVVPVVIAAGAILLFGFLALR